MKPLWIEKKLGEVVRLEYGKPLPPEKRRANGQYCVFGANGPIDRTDEYYWDKKSIIVGRKGSAGELKLTEERFWPLDVTYFVVFDDKHYDLQFLYYLFANLNLPRLAKGVKPGINRNDVYALTVKIPPLDEQRRIVAKLDKAFAAIDQAKINTEKNLQNIKELFDYFLEERFTYKNDGVETTLGEIAKIRGGKRVPKGYKLQTIPTKHPYIRVTDFTDDGTIDTSDLHYVNDEIFKQIKNYTISTDNVYISIAGTIGKTGIIPQELNGANLTENACKLDFRKQIVPRYIYYFTKTKNFINQAGTNTRIAAMPKLALSRLSTIKLKLPIRTEIQEKIVQDIDNLQIEKRKIEQKYQIKIIKLEELRRSILQKAFNGEL